MGFNGFYRVSIRFFVEFFLVLPCSTAFYWVFVALPIQMSTLPCVSLETHLCLKFNFLFLNRVVICLFSPLSLGGKVTAGSYFISGVDTSLLLLFFLFFLCFLFTLDFCFEFRCLGALLQGGRLPSIGRAGGRSGRRARPRTQNLPTGNVQRTSPPSLPSLFFFSTEFRPPLLYLVLPSCTGFSTEFLLVSS